MRRANHSRQSRPGLRVRSGSVRRAPNARNRATVERCATTTRSGRISNLPVRGLRGRGVIRRRQPRTGETRPETCPSQTTAEANPGTTAGGRLAIEHCTRIEKLYCRTALGRLGRVRRGQNEKIMECQDDGFPPTEPEVIEKGRRRIWCCQCNTWHHEPQVGNTKRRRQADVLGRELPRTNSRSIENQQNPLI